MTVSLIPKGPYFVETDRPLIAHARLLSVRWEIEIAPGYQWELRATSRSDSSLTAVARFPLGEMPEVIRLTGSLHGPDDGPLEVTPGDVFRQIVGGYNFANVSAEKWAIGGKKPRIAFTVIAGSQPGGGTTQLYRYANWLCELGYAVTIYSDDPAVPAWANLKARYTVLGDGAHRYSAIDEDIIIVYSILELPAVLQSANRSRQKILHFCQGLEEFHFGANFSEVMAPKPIFRLLNALPVGRLVVSPALFEYFRNEFKQRSFLIPNGIDPVFTEAASRTSAPSFGAGNRPIRFVQVCNPGQMSKGAELTLSALALLGKRYSESRLNLHIDFISGPTPADSLMLAALPAGVSYGIKSGLSPEEMLREYRTADIVINSSFHEGFGLSTVEALASGAMVIQADNFGLDGLIDGLSNPLVVPRNNVTALASAIGSLLELPEAREGLRGDSVAVARRFSIERQQASFVEAFEQIVEGRLDRRCFDRVKPGPIKQPAAAVEVREPPRFSVLVPVYNHGHFLPETLNTLIAQSYPHWEAIVVNDGSTDSTPGVMAAYAARDQRFKLVHQANGGTAAALNTALSHASNDWICWLSSDDFFKRDKLEIHARYIESLPQIRFFHSLFTVFDDEVRKETFSIPPTHQATVSPALQTSEMFMWNPVHGNTIAVHRDIFRDVGNFRPEYPNAQDYDMWLRMSRYAKFFLINKVTCTTRVHSGAGTVQFPLAGIFDSYRSLIDMANKLKFEQFFPFISGASEEELFCVVRHLVCCALQPNAFLYQGALGRRSPLLERLIEYYSSAACEESVQQSIRIAVRDGLAIMGRRQEPMLNLDKFCDVFARKPTAPAPYKPINAIQEMVACYGEALRYRSLTAVDAFRRYFQKLRRHGIAGIPDLDEIFGSLESHQIKLEDLAAGGPAGLSTPGTPGFLSA